LKLRTVRSRTALKDARRHAREGVWQSGKLQQQRKVIFMLRRILVGDNERVFLIRKGRFEDILAPGEYWIFGFGVRIERHDIRQVIVCSQWTDFLVKQRWELASRHFTIVETTDSQVAIVYFDDKVSRVIGPGARVLFWRGPVEVTYDVIDAQANPQAPALLVPALARVGVRESHATFAVIDEGKRGLLYLDGRFLRELAPGSYAFWNVAGTPRVDILDLRLQTVEIGGQEILTRDKVSVRVNITANYQIVDAITARSAVKDVCEHLYRTLQIAVRQTLGRRTLEEVLADKVSIDESVSAEVRRDMAGYGVRVGEIAIKDIILPGDIRDILNQVVTAEKQAQANLIRRREETAATRSLLNTAKLMEDNPLLVRLKELETLERVADKVDTITVVDGLNRLLDGSVKISR
jgi:regulator of protease activity HflC (stomatin/prohibitin superfamily)